jgi:hypothetical protein
METSSTQLFTKMLGSMLWSLHMIAARVERTIRVSTMLGEPWAGTRHARPAGLSKNQFGICSSTPQTLPFPPSHMLKPLKKIHHEYSGEYATNSFSTRISTNIYE